MAISTMETDVRQEDSHLLQFIYQVPVGLAQLDNSGSFLLLNAVGVALMLPIAGVSGLSNFFDLIRARAPELIETVERHTAVGEICRDQRILIQYGAGSRYISFTIIRLDNTTLMLTFSDVTALVDAERRTREALEAHAALVSGRAEMAASMLHDIGNAIVGISTRSAQLAADPAWPETEYLSRLSGLLESQASPLAGALGDDKAEALIGLSSALERNLRQREIALRGNAHRLVESVTHIEDILSVQRQYARQGNRGSHHNSVAVEGLVQDALAIYSAALEKQGVQVSCHIPPGLPPLKLDRTRMIQVLGNLIKNAGEAFQSFDIDSGPRCLTISADKTDEGGVSLMFKDNGIGFEPARAHSFFARGTTTKPLGSGLGLASCRATIESHGGVIRMESEGIGKGATVTIQLPSNENEIQNA